MLWRPLSIRPIFRSVSKRTFSWVKPRVRRIDFNRSITCSTKMSLRRCRFIIQRSGFLLSKVTTHLSYGSESVISEVPGGISNRRCPIRPNIGKRAASGIPAHAQQRKLRTATKVKFFPNLHLPGRNLSLMRSKIRN